MRVLTLVPNLKGHSPGQRGSIELWERVLAPAGIQLDYVPFESESLRRILYDSGRHVLKAAEMIRAYANRIDLLKNLDGYDAVFVYREAALLGPAFLEKKIARRKPIIYQLDDPLFVPYKSPSNGVFSYLKFFGKIKEIIGLSSSVIVNSTPIREYAERYNANVRQVPSVVDTDDYVYDPADQQRKPLSSGWSGSMTTARNIKLIENPLRRLSERRLCDIRLIGSDDFGLTGVNYHAQVWNATTEIDDLRKIQIGLVPLPSDNPWNPYKFIMKTAQYMALGIVPVGTQMASNTEVIRNGENGFLATTDNEWFDDIKQLCEDEQLRISMSQEAVRDAREKYSLQANANKIVEAFRSAVE